MSLQECMMAEQNSTPFSFIALPLNSVYASVILFIAFADGFNAATERQSPVSVQKCLQVQYNNGMINVLCLKTGTTAARRIPTAFRTNKSSSCECDIRVYK